MSGGRGWNTSPEVSELMTDLGLGLVDASTEVSATMTDEDHILVVNNALLPEMIASPFKTSAVVGHKCFQVSKYVME